MEEERKPEYPEKIPDDELQKMPQTKAPKFKSQPRLKRAHDHWWQAWKAHVLAITSRVELDRVELNRDGVVQMWSWPGI